MRGHYRRAALSLCIHCSGCVCARVEVCCWKVSQRTEAFLEINTLNMLLKAIRPKNATMNWLYLLGAGTRTSQINTNDLTKKRLNNFIWKDERSMHHRQAEVAPLVQKYYFILVKLLSLAYLKLHTTRLTNDNVSQVRIKRQSY